MLNESVDEQLVTIARCDVKGIVIAMLVHTVH